MKKVFNIILALFLMLVITMGIIGNENIDEKKVLSLNRDSIENLREIDFKSGRTYADLLIDEIPGYRYYEMNFKLSLEYSPDYILTSSETRKKLYEHFTSRSHAIYISSKTLEEIDIYVFYFESPESAQAEWIESLEMYSIPKLAPADKNNIFVGDVAVGTQSFLNFIRGNIGIRIRGVNGNSVVEVAKEIDNQILIALDDAKKRSDRLAS